VKVVVASDHAGFAYKGLVLAHLSRSGHEAVDLGTSSAEPVDYPLFIRPAALAVGRGDADRGVVIGGSGNGEAIVANRIPHVRCALCWSVEAARLARAHNDANMLSLGQRLLAPELALAILDVWLDTPFDGGHHARRIAEIDDAGLASP
jgi:ribose 5-phosphate isomerase B